MSPQRRTALVSVAAACALLALKLTAGIASGSLGLVSEALHSGTDLVAALLTFFAIGVSGRPADEQHQYGHGKAEHLAALFEAGVLAIVSVGVAGLAVARLAGWIDITVDAAWWTFLVIGLVLVIDIARTTTSLRTARRFHSAALLSNAVHFGSDFAGSLAVLVGLIGVRAGWSEADSVAALFVAVLVLSAALRLMRRNVDVLMDRAPADAEEAVRVAIAEIEPPVTLRRLRMRSAAGRHFADVVIAVSAGAAVGQGHAAADAVEAAVERALPETDVVVHVEPAEEDAVTRELAHAAAMRVPRVREIHNIAVLHVGGRTEVSLHLKLPGDLSLEEAHAIASEVERAIEEAVPDVDAVETHLEPLTEEAEGIARSTRTSPPRFGGSSSSAPAPRRASCACSRRPTDWSCSSRWASTVPRRSPRRTGVPARSRRRSAARCRRSRRSSSTPSHEARLSSMKLCMFSPTELDLERGWPGRIEGDRVIQLAAQTLQSFFTGGGVAREHAEYPLADVVLRAPVLRPPSVRDFYAFEQHVKTARGLRGQEVPPSGTSCRSSTSRTRPRSTARRWRSRIPTAPRSSTTSSRSPRSSAPRARSAGSP